MSNLEKYKNVFKNVFELDEKEIINSAFGENRWDSVGHMGIVSGIEDCFGIELENEDIIDFSTYEKGIAILRDRYGIQF